MKLKTQTTIIGILLLVISCTKENNPIHSSSASKSVNETLILKIGQHYGGGIIFYIDSTGQHGLIADTIDLPKSTWWNQVHTATGATSRAIGSGKKNTKKIISVYGDSGRYAARLCWKYTENGYSDWFLPSKDELNELHKQRKVVGGLHSDWYWSSTEAPSKDNLAWMQHFETSFVVQYTEPKSSKYYARAIRAF